MSLLTLELLWHFISFAFYFYSIGPQWIMAIIRQCGLSDWRVVVCLSIIDYIIIPLPFKHLPPIRAFVSRPFINLWEHLKFWQVVLAWKAEVMLCGLPWQSIRSANMWMAILVGKANSHQKYLSIPKKRNHSPLAQGCVLCNEPARWMASVPKEWCCIRGVELVSSGDRWALIGGRSFLVKESPLSWAYACPQSLLSWLLYIWTWYHENLYLLLMQNCLCFPPLFRHGVIHSISIYDGPIRPHIFLGNSQSGIKSLQAH